MGSEKMSKSLGNVTLVHDLLKEWDGEVIRLALLKAHYRSELNWSEDLLKESEAQLDGWYRAFSEPEVFSLRDYSVSVSDLKSDFWLFDDIDLPNLFSSISRNFKEATIWLMTGRKFNDFDVLENGIGPSLFSLRLLGLLQKDPEDWFKGGASSDDQAEFDAIALRRQEARAAKDWAAADAARDEATAKGIVLEDGPDGTTWRKA